jgi:hypothetical protein
MLKIVDVEMDEITNIGDPNERAQENNTHHPVQENY